MSGFIYLIRNRDLYMIGKTNDLQDKMRLLKPDETLKTIRVENPTFTQARIFRKFKRNRIPETEYFRLTKRQVKDCITYLNSTSLEKQTIAAEFTTGLSGSLLLFVIFLFVSSKIGFALFNSLALSFYLASIPMWFLLITGNFGGYDNDDLPMFTSFLNRCKAFLLAFFFVSIGYLLG